MYIPHIYTRIHQRSGFSLNSSDFMFIHSLLSTKTICTLVHVRVEPCFHNH